MKRSFKGFLIALTITVSAAFACAADAPVLLSHTLTGYSKSATAVTLSYSLHVENPAEKAVGDLSLALVPRPAFVTAPTVLNIGSLAPKEARDINLKVVTPMLLDQEWFARAPLSWAGRWVNAEGKPIDFPIKSVPGGAK